MHNLPEKYRPNCINELLGQKNAKLVYDLADTYIAPAYLFFGPPGTGKTSMAKLLISKTEDTTAVIHDKFPSEIIEINCGMNGNVDDIKDVIINKCQTPPRIFKRKYVILDEAQMLSLSAQNALLNIMEKPPAWLTFILCTTEHRKIINAIKSRCMQIKFLNACASDIVDNLKLICDSENIKYDELGLNMIADLSNGSFRESIVLLSQYSSLGATHENVEHYSGAASRENIEDFVLCMLSKDHKSIVIKSEEFNKSNIKTEEILRHILEILTDIILKSMGAEKRVNKQIEKLSNGVPLIKICDIVNDGIKNMSPSTPDYLHFQVVIFKVMRAINNAN